MGGKSQVVDPKKFHLCWAGGSDGPSVKTRDDRRARSRPLLTLTAAQGPLDGICERRASKTKNGFKGLVSSHVTRQHVWNLRESTKHGTSKRGRRSCSPTRKSLTWTVLMVSNVTGTTKRSHQRHFRHDTVEVVQSWFGVLFPSMEQCSFRWCRGVKRQLATWKCCSRHPSWLRALVYAGRNGSFSRTMLPFTTHVGQWTSSMKTTSLFWTTLHVPLILIQLRTFGDGWQGKFTKMGASSRQWMPFVTQSSPHGVTFPSISWKLLHQACLKEFLKWSTRTEGVLTSELFFY